MIIYNLLLRQHSCTRYFFCVAVDKGITDPKKTWNWWRDKGSGEARWRWGQVLTHFSFPGTAKNVLSGHGKWFTLTSVVHSFILGLVPSFWSHNCTVCDSHTTVHYSHDPWHNKLICIPFKGTTPSQQWGGMKAMSCWVQPFSLYLRNSMKHIWVWLHTFLYM